MAEQTYLQKLEAKSKILREKLQKAENKKSIDLESSLLIEHITGEVNELFKKMTDGEPLEREAYIEAHTAASVYRKMYRALVPDQNEIDTVNRQLKENNEKIKVAPKE